MISDSCGSGAGDSRPGDSRPGDGRPGVGRPRPMGGARHVHVLAATDVDVSDGSDVNLLNEGGLNLRYR